MESINKFKALTIIIICMFVFIIAAIYSNTKDVAGSKTQQKSEAVSNENKQNENNVQTKQASSVEYLESQFDFLNKRVDELSEKISSDDSGVKCKIIGVSGSEGIVKLSQDAALEDARDNGSELVITCSF